ncbi:MAG: Crp/Fnr family transcriptional regulator [Nitrospirales bacterium]|nr:Crp/Fnr family transcriptional regulator [Nitrospirales bacterium]
MAQTLSGPLSGDDPLLKSSLFAGLSGEELGEIGRVVSRRRYAKNEVVLREEDTGRYMYFVCSGSVKVVQVSLSGREQIMAIHRRGDSFGEMALLDGKTLPARVVAMEESTVCLLSKQDFDRRLLTNPQAARTIIMTLCERLREAWLRLNALSFADAEQRVRTVLLILGARSDFNCETGTLIDLRLTHEAIAGYASVSRETVSRLLSRLAKEGEIEISHTGILLKPIFFKKTSLL